ncbi:MAG: hypothetical protein JKY43_01995 [Phycisphaerales bacterium]|nr:hypothetical protein [Phycisphaerales bacterium]
MVELLRGQLEEFVDGVVLFDGHSRGLYSTDASIYQVMPRGVVVPGSLEGVRHFKALLV